MTHRGLLLLLEGPLQSWGTQSRFSQRETDFEPSKSGVLGLVGAALGMPREDEEMLRRLARLSMAVRVDREGRVLRDFHTAGAGTYRGQEHGVYGTKHTVVTNRFYLMDACFVVALSGDDLELIDQIVGAFKNPRWPLFLGRRSCVPSQQIFLCGPLEGRAEELLKTVPLRVNSNTTDGKVRCVLEDEPQKGGSFGRPRADVPRSFRRYDRRFDTRFIHDVWWSATEFPGGEHVPVSPDLEQPIA